MSIRRRSVALVENWFPSSQTQVSPFPVSDVGFSGLMSVPAVLSTMARISRSAVGDCEAVA
jgi:hypothetical protein